MDSEAAALDHRRAAHPDARVLGGDDDVAAAQQRGVAGEAEARGDADQRHEPAEPGEVAETRGSPGRPRSACRRRRAGRRRPRRTAPRAAAGARRSRTGGPSWRGCATPGCRPARCSRRTAPRTGSPGDRSPPRRPGHRRACARSAPGDRGAPPGRRRSAARTRRSEPSIEEIGEVLARRAPVLLVAFGDGVGPGGVETERVAGADRLEVGSLGVRRRPSAVRLRRPGPAAGVGRRRPGAPRR